MATERQKYKAYTLNIAGFALMAPLGKIFVQPEVIFKFDPVWLLVFVIVSLTLLMVGIIFVGRGCDILDE